MLLDSLDRAEKEEIDLKLIGHAMVCSVLANIHRDSKKRREPFTPADFMPGRKKEKPKQTAQDHINMVIALNRAFGGRVANKAPG